MSSITTVRGFIRITIMSLEHMISANYANFGHIPYGQSIVSTFLRLTISCQIGQVYVDEDHIEGCE